MEELEQDKSSLYELLWYLQTASPEKATSLLQQLRAAQGEDIGALLNQFDQNRHASPEPASSTNVLQTESTSPATATSTILAVPEVRDHPLFSTLQKGLAGVPGIALHSPAQQHATVHGLHGPLETFFNCVGALFYVMNWNEIRAKVEAIAASGNSQTPLGMFFTNGSTLQLKTFASELAGMAAIGVVHSQLADPKAAPPAELADYFYSVAKHGLDSAIMYNPLRAMTICALLGMYNIVVKATVALAYIELGLSLASRYKLHLKQCPPDWSTSEYENIRRTYRTLIHLQCWLSASLDYTSDSLRLSVESSAEDGDAPPEDMIRRECVKVSIIKAALLRRMPADSPVPEAITLDFRTQLSKFHADLPPWMGIASLVSGDDGELMTQFRPVIFYVHLFYLSAMMLLARRLVIAYIPVDTVGRAHLPPEAQRAVEEGYQAAQTNASVMNLMLQEGKVVQVCWLCIFTSYTAGIMIAHTATHKALRGEPFPDDMELLTKCISVLDYCAQKDALAGQFRDLLSAHFDILKEDGSVDGIGTSANFPMDTYLFEFQPGSSKLHCASRQLLETIHRPFSGLKNVATHKTLSNCAETAMGTHLEWEYELKGEECCESINAVPEPVMLPQPQGEAWTRWTPATWQDSFSVSQT